MNNTQKPKICDASRLFGLNVALEEQEQLDYVKVKDLVDTKATFSIERITYKSDVPSDYAESDFVTRSISPSTSRRWEDASRS